MGCLPSKEGGPGGPGGPARKASPRPLPKYVVSDPDLGWRNVTDSLHGYPLKGFHADFQNERSGNLLKRQNLVALAINIAERSSKLANRYGVTDEGGLQSSSNLLEDLAKFNQGGQEDTWQIDVDKDMKTILKHFGCPKFGWKLLARVYPTGPLINSSPEIFLQNDNAEAANDEHGLAEDHGVTAAGLSQLATIPEHMQLLADHDKKECLLDVSELAINIAEQLFRLEKSESTGHKIPGELFGWKCMTSGTGMVPTLGQTSRENFAVPVVTPEGEALMLIPEELIMNVASWVQQTYLTAPAF